LAWSGVTSDVQAATSGVTSDVQAATNDAKNDVTERGALDRAVLELQHRSMFSQLRVRRGQCLWRKSAVPVFATAARLLAALLMTEADIGD
jgi:hypothetical protein